MTSLPTPPDSALARAAADLAARVEDPWLVAHSVRTFLFGHALLDTLGRPVDAEVLYVGSMLHDLALGTELDDGVTPFELIGAARAREIVLAAGGGELTAELAADSIRLHLDLATADDPRPEVAGVHLGAAADVVGLRLDEVPPEVVEAAVEAQPRLDMKRHVVEVFGAEAARKPDSTAAALVRDVGILDLAAAAPFSE